MTREEFQKRYGYDANSRLGNGAFGSVFKAWDDERNCHVALKIQAVNPKMPDIRLKREVEMAAKLNHPNIAHYDTCYTFEDLNGESDVAVMSYYENGSLDNLLRSVPLTFEQREDILVQILDGIAYLHYNGIVHRDLKPQNILILHLKGCYIPKITDFGISKQVRNNDGSLLHNSIIGGTENYGAPEQMAGHEIRKNADLWSFGIIAMQMMCEKYGFDYQEIYKGVLPAELNAVPMQWQALIRQCLIPDLNKRISSADECLSIIGKTLTFDPKNIGKNVKPKVDNNDGDGGGTIIEKPQDKSDKPKKKRTGVWVLMFVLLAMAVGAAAAYYLMGDKSATLESVETVVEPTDSGPEEAPEPQPNVEPLEDLVKETKASKPVESKVTTPKVDAPIQVAPKEDPKAVQVEKPIAEPQQNVKQEPKPKESQYVDSGATAFTLQTSTMNVASDAGSYVVGYTIKNPVKGKVVGVGKSANWITNVQAKDGNITFKTTKNTSSRSRTGTITASYNGIRCSIEVVQSGVE